MFRRRKNPKSSTDHHRVLNDDVVTEILLHLPVQSLLRFRAVCKSWCNIIDSPTFRKLHVQHQLNNNDDNNNTVFLLFNADENLVWKLSIIFPGHWRLYKAIPSFQAPFNTNNRFLDVAGPVNGLVCIYQHPSFDINVSIVLCNPCLGEIKILPKCSFLSNPCEDHHSVLCRHIGFGFDYDTKDYKVVQLLCCQGSRRIRVEVYSRTTNTWRELAALDQDLSIKKRVKSSYKNGSFAYWHARRGSQDVLLSFDMHDEVFQTISFPDYPDKLEKTEVFAKDDSFVLFVYHDLRFCDRCGRVLDLGARWCPACSIPLNQDDQLLKIYELKTESNTRYRTHVSNVGPFERVPRPAALWKSDGVVLVHYSDRKRNEKKKLIFYDYSTRKIRRRSKMPEDVHGFEILEHKGSLISP